MRVEVIKVPVANPAAAAVVNRANIFSDLKAPATHGASEEDVRANKRAVDSTRAAGGFLAKNPQSGEDLVIPAFISKPLIDSIVKARGGSTPTAADSATLRANMQSIINRLFGAPSG